MDFEVVLTRVGEMFVPVSAVSIETVSQATVSLLSRGCHRYEWGLCVCVFDSFNSAGNTWLDGLVTPIIPW